MKDDPTIRRIRETRHKISERFDHNVEKIVDHYIKMQRGDKGRLITAGPHKKKQAAH